MPPKRTLIVFSAAIAFVYAVWTLRSGVQLAVDTPTYSRWADTLIALGFNPAAYLREQSFVAPPILYLGWVTVVAIMKAVLGSAWMSGIVALNVIALAAGAFATLSAIRKTTASGASMLLGAALFIVAGDLLLFVPYVLSDLMFWALSTGVLACGVRLAATEPGESGSGRLVMAGSGLLLIAIIFRPVAIPLAAFWIVALASRPAAGLIDRFVTPLLVTVLIGSLAAILLHAYVLLEPGAWPIGPYPAILTLVRDEYKIGMFVHQASPPMLVPPPADFLGFVRITLQKLIFFITPWLPHYSVAHTAINLVFFLPAYGLSVAAIANIRRLLPSQQRAVFVLAVFVLFVSVFHSMLLIDSDHRYRLPVLPALITLAAIGLESVRRPRTLGATVRRK